MVSRRVLGAVAVVGLGAGFALALPPHVKPPAPAALNEVNRLYHEELTLTAHETHLQALLNFARAELARTPAVQTPVAGPPTPVELVASPPPAPSSGLPPAQVVSAAPVPTPEPPDTTTTAPPPTTTTTTPSTTTTTQPFDGGDPGGVDN